MPSQWTPPAGSPSSPGGDLWRSRQADLASAIDEQLWDEREELWIDRADVPAPGRLHHGDSYAIPTLDGVLGSLGTASRERAERALRQCVGSGRFAAPFGRVTCPGTTLSTARMSTGVGPAWPQLNFLLVEAARHHGLDDIAGELAATTVRGAWASHFSEYWDPETGAACGATPQSWTAIVAAL